MKDPQKDILNDIPALIRRMEPDLTISFINNAYAALIGVASESVQGVKIDTLPGEAGNNLPLTLKTLTPAKPQIISRKKIEHGTGTFHWIEWTDRALFDDKGELRGYQSIGMDITNQMALDSLLTLQRDLAISLDTSLSMEEAFKLIGQAVTSIDTIDFCAVYRRKDDRTSLDQVYQKGLTDEFAKKAASFKENSYQYQVLTCGKPLYKPFRETQFAQMPGHANSAIHAFGAVPVKYNGETIASFMIGSATGEIFSDNVRSTVEAIAGQVGGILIEKMIEHELRLTNERFELAIQGGNLGTWDWNIKTGKVVFNDRWAEMLGYTLEELDGDVSTWEKLVHPDDLEEIMAILNNHLEGKTDLYQTEHRLKTKDGSWQWVLDTGRVFTRDREGNPTRAVGTHLDINTMKNLENRLRELSIRDFLTGLYNRMYIFERLEEMVAYYRRTDQPISVALLDLDYFKSINDTRGHLAGDFILKEFSDILTKNIRPYDLLGRYGGEEFIIIFYEADIEFSVKAMERIRQDIEQTPFQFKGDNIQLTFSCGIAGFSELDPKEITPDKIIEQADFYLYRAKKSGRNRIVTME